MDFSQIEAVFFDCDGVFTDGKISFDSEGRERRVYDMQDGMGITLLRNAGKFLCVMSSSTGHSIERRMEMLKIQHTYTKVPDKGELIQSLAAEHNLDLKKTAFVGDDLVDIPPMRIVGFPIAVQNAVKAVKDVALYTTTNSGGNGAIREIAELILDSTDSITGEVTQ